MTNLSLNLALLYESKQTISRVLYLMTINLVPMLPSESSGLPGGLKADHFIPLYLAFLPVGFTMPLQSLRERWALTLSRYQAPPFHPYLVNSVSQGGIFSVALSLGSLPLCVTEHCILWSSDFPLQGLDGLYNP
ncbi:hypothetical protein S225a_16750 [Candidatus Brocadiaceae bacterium S225]|uniref:Uncharacterized protein n=1 Tax=Candidatus Scalindua brodae TaxID=237368 RepID=A0A0B0EPY8_9BACT|nr:MAG: hypothetical protein SCABRO_01513 [Candidatus Scalindua brodae]TWU32725.1 hypothetical protein S225a_16750 [Candidatus Brocadiaceae bacterium S225]